MSVIDAKSLNFYDVFMVYKKLLKKSIILLPNQTLTVKGFLFDNSGFSLSIDAKWNVTTEKEF